MRAGDRGADPGAELRPTAGKAPAPHRRGLPEVPQVLRYHAPPGLDAYNTSRERLFQLEKEGRALLFAPHSTEGFHRTEKDVEKIRALWKDGYDEGMERLDEVQAFLSGS